MQFLASYWFVFLMVAFVLVALAMINQFKRITRMLSGLDTFFDGVGSMIVMMLGGFISGILAIIGIIAALVDYAA